MARIFGAVLCAGYGPEALERYTWGQLQTMAECITQYHAQFPEMLLKVAASVMGADYAPGQVAPRAGTEGSRRTRIDYADAEQVARAEQRDAQILRAASGIDGIDIEL